MREKQNSTALMDEMFGLLLAGYAPIEIREKLGVSIQEWASIQNDVYWHDLILGNGEHSNKQLDFKKRLKEIQQIERDLFLNLELLKMWEEGSKERAEIMTKVNDLQGRYSHFNLFV